MKFRAVINDIEIMKEFSNTILTLSKLTRECVMIISKDKVNIVINEESTCSSPLICIKIDRSTYFDEYIMSGINEKFPDIFISVNPANLSRALSILRTNNASYVKLKLMNKQFPCITVNIELPSASSVQNRSIMHDVPVNLIPTQDWDLFKLPDLPNSRFILKMPNVKFLRNLIDKLKNLSSTITICATTKGEFSIILETDQATVASHYQHLEVKKLNNSSENDNIDDEISCHVDCKKMATFLTALQHQNLQLCFGIIQDHIIHIEVECSLGVKMMCIIPAVCID